MVPQIAQILVVSVATICSVHPTIGVAEVCAVDTCCSTVIDVEFISFIKAVVSKASRVEILTAYLSILAAISEVSAIGGIPCQLQKNRTMT